MKLKEKTININFVDLMQLKTKYRFNCLRLGTAFKKDFSGLIIGGEDGIIRLYDMTTKVETDHPQIQLETKGGPVQTLAVHDVTKFYNDDIVSGDSQGMLTVFCNQQILSRHSLAKNSIRCLQIYKDHLGNSCIVTSDESGCITALLPSKDLWRINVNELPLAKALTQAVSAKDHSGSTCWILYVPFMGPSQKTVVSSMLCADLVSPTGETCSYILAADDTKHLHIIQQGEIVMTMTTPDVVTAMCHGLFIDTEKLDVGPDPVTSRDMTQVALGCASGAIHILHNFTITEEEFANAKYNITQMLTHPSSTGKIEHILCAGHFCGLYVYHEGKRVGNYETSDWINTMDISISSKSRKPEVVVGCLDNSIYGFTVVET